VSFRDCALAVGLSGLAMLRSAAAADGPIEDGLLEFLGSVDSEDQAWHDYLAGTDIDQVARRAANAPGNPGAPAPPAPPPPMTPAAAGTPGPGDPPQVGHP
jgi:hypothetical protein